MFLLSNLIIPPLKGRKERILYQRRETTDSKYSTIHLENLKTLFVLQTQKLNFEIKN